MRKLLFLVMVSISIQYSYAQSYNYEQGVKAYDEMDLEKALDYFGREIKDDPKAALSYYYCAIIYNYKEQNSSALSNINNAIKNISSKDKKILSAAYQVRATIYFKIEKQEKAFDDYATALKLTPDDPEIYTDRAEYYYILKQFKKAEEDYRCALKIDESYIVSYAGLGRNYLAEKNYVEAEKILGQLIKLSPDYGTGYFYRAQVYFEEKKYDDAINDIFQCYLLDESDKDSRALIINYSEKNYSLSIAKVNAQISIKPANESWYFIRAQINEGKRNFKQSINDYTKLMDIMDISVKPSLLAYRAACYSNLGMHEQSISDYTEATSLDSTDAYNYGRRGDEFRLVGKYSQAILDFTKAIEIEPMQTWFYYRRGWIEEEFMNDIDAGMNDYNEAISLDKQYAYTYLHRGRLFETKLNNPTKAKDDYLTLLSLDTIPGETGNCRQYALFHLGRNQEAIEWMKKIIEQYPTDGNYYDASCLYSLMNKPSEAIASLKVAFKKGYRDFVHLSADDDLDNIRNLPEFKNLVQEWVNSFDESLVADVSEKSSNSEKEIKTVSIPMKSKGGGTYEVPCKINDLGLNMIFDTGASDISISQTEVQFMLKNGYLTNNDITGTQKYMDANGNIEIGTTLIFRKVDFGGLILKNVKASVVHNKNAPLLFGQSALSKYGKITIDNESKIIIITSN
jgi:clan AA aspartic protease (TIGR02281 family)